MMKFRSGALDIAYVDSGIGYPVVMLHGFGLNSKTCWLSNGWQESLAAAGLRMIAMDSRGHGESAKSTVPADYSADDMTRDVINLLNHLHIERANLVGHSMGGRTLLNLLIRYPDRVNAALGISIGSNVFVPVNSAPFIKALLTEDISTIPAAVLDDVLLIRSLGNDMPAMVACLGSSRPVPSKLELNGIRAPVLLVNGAEDHLVGDPSQLAAEIPGAETVTVAGCSHSDVLKSAVLRQSAIEFLRKFGEVRA